MKSKAPDFSARTAVSTLPWAVMTATGVRSHYSERFKAWGFDLPASIYEPIQ